MVFLTSTHRLQRNESVLTSVLSYMVALDIWSVGVILLCFLSGRFPFFNSDDDLEALLEIAVVFGQREMAAVAATFSKLNIERVYFFPIAHARHYDPNSRALLHRVCCLIDRTFLTTIPAIKDYGVSRAKICRLMNPTRFGKPDQRSSQSSSRSSRSAQTNDRPQRSSSRNLDAQTAPVSDAHGRSVPMQAPDPTFVASKVDLQNRSSAHKQDALLEPDTRRRAHDDLMTRGKDRKAETAPTAPSAAAATQPDGEVTSSNPDPKPSTSSGTKITGKLTIHELEAAYIKSLNIVGTESDEDFMDAIDLLDKLMALDPTKRITARQALKHRFLAEDKP